MKNNNRIKLTGIIFGELLTVCTILFLLATKQYGRLPMAFCTLLFVLLPAIMEWGFRCSLCLPVYIFALLYAVGPMMGQCWLFYYTISWWDNLLHACGGVMFAIVGAYFFERLTRRKDHILAEALFALCFSVAIAALWEFAEFGADFVLGMETQDDTMITHLTSYLLGDSAGITGSIGNIQSVIVNGVPLPGYIDIGLIDTMTDMILESLGALITCLLYLFDRGRYPLIQDEIKTEKEKAYGKRICDL